ncbi:MAG: RiPP maturation radical SAM C-methyltransferase [Kiritimatiellae bacterium]|nr:RiPP maturation radical SAM C-methyltransferase [Kiritimatiellia bacterium]
MKQRPLRIVFLNMPFAKVTAPSLALAQLELVLKATFENEIRVDIHYLNMDFALHVGDLHLYDHPYTSYGSMTRSSDWFFRQLAFPNEPDNSKEYFERYYFEDDPGKQRVREFLLEKRKDIDKVFNSYIDKYHLLDADIVGFTLLFSETCSSFGMARMLKERKPEIITMIGGASCEGETAQVYAERIPQIDYVFSGPALFSLPQLIKHLLAGDREKCDHINGILTKTNKKLWHMPVTSCNQPPVPVPPEKISTTGGELDINANLIPDYSAFLDAFEKNFPDGKIKPMLIFETSRGCAWGERRQCAFCGLNGLTLRYRVLTPENAITQIHALYRYIPRARFFIAADNMLPENYTREVLPFLKPPPEQIQIRYEVRATLTAEDIDIMCKAGFSRVQPGIEALSTPTLRLLRKGTTAFSNLQFLKDSSKHAFTLDWNLLTYTPGEKEDVYEKYMHYIPLLYHLPPPNAVFPIMYVKFSHYFEHAQEYGFNLQPQDYYSLIFPFSDKDIRRLAYRFVDRNADADRMDQWLDRLNEASAKWRIRWMNEDDKEQSRLCFENVPEPTIYDSRSGEISEYKVSSLTKSVLDRLEKPASRDDLIKEFGDHPGFEVDHEIKFMMERGLLFEEDGSYMSLIAG